jgi:hypothetical protein
VRGCGGASVRVCVLCLDVLKRDVLGVRATFRLVARLLLGELLEDLQGVCKGVQGCARVCKGVQGCARVCKGCARGVQGCVRVCKGVQGVCKGGARGC